MKNLNNKRERLANYRFGGIWIRLLAQVVDCIFLFLLMILMIKLGLTEFGFEKVEKQFKIIILLIFATYTIILPATRLQATLGMLIFNIKIVNLNMERISYFRSLMRFIILQTPSLMSGLILVNLLGFNNYLATICVLFLFISISFDKFKRGFHDFICRTYVIYNN